MKQRDVTQVGWMFDDGCHLMARPYMPIVINANSKHKEVVWKFLRFLLGKEAQASVYPYCSVNRKVFLERVVEPATKLFNNILNKSLIHISIVSGEREIISYSAEDREFLENEKIPNFVQMLEDARYLPTRTQPLLDIICEEAEAYFSGVKSKEEVIAIIENHVKLYMSKNIE